MHARNGAAAGVVAQPPQRAGSVSWRPAFGSERFLFGGAADWRGPCHSGAGGEVSFFYRGGRYLAGDEINSGQQCARAQRRTEEGSSRCRASVDRLPRGEEAVPMYVQKVDICLVNCE